MKALVAFVRDQKNGEMDGRTGGRVSEMCVLSTQPASTPRGK